VRWLRSVGRVERRTGHPPRVGGVVVDITERSLAAERLAASEARHRALAEGYARAAAAAHIAPYEWDTETGARTGSPDREALYGRPPGSLNDDRSTPEAVHPDDRGIVRAFQQRMRRASDGETVANEYRVVWPDGQVRWLRNICRVSVSPGGARRVSGVLFDISEGKRDAAQLALSERRYRLLAEHVGTTLWRAAPSGSITHAHGWTTLTGQQEGEYQGHGWEEVVHPDDRPATYAAWRRAVLTQEPVDFEYRVRNIDSGEWLWVRARAVPVRPTAATSSSGPGSARTSTSGSGPRRRWRRPGRGPSGTTGRSRASSPPPATTSASRCSRCTCSRRRWRRTYGRRARPRTGG
jgi:PAS domain S-box-containing protein